MFPVDDRLCSGVNGSVQFKRPPFEFPYRQNKAPERLRKPQCHKQQETRRNQKPRELPNQLLCCHSQLLAGRLTHL
jgi:hypothetical protein